MAQISNQQLVIRKDSEGNERFKKTIAIREELVYPMRRVDDIEDGEDLFEPDFTHVKYKCNILVRKADLEDGNLKFNVRLDNGIEQKPKGNLVEIAEP